MLKMLTCSITIYSPISIVVVLLATSSTTTMGVRLQSLSKYLFENSCIILAGLLLTLKGRKEIRAPFWSPFL